MIAFEMQNKLSILKQQGCWGANGLQGKSNFSTKIVLDIPLCTSVLLNYSKQQAAIPCKQLYLWGHIQ